MWRVVSTELAHEHGRHACAEYLRGARRPRSCPAPGCPSSARSTSAPRADRLAHPAGARPRADPRVLRLTGRAAVPVDAVHPPPLGAVLHTRARHRPRDRRPRQHAREPGVRRPVPGGRTGVVAVRAPTTALDRFSRVFWFTLEFGVVHEDEELRAYGAGLLSSYGEIEAFQDAEIRPWDLEAMARIEYDITVYQPCSTRRRRSTKWSRISPPTSRGSDSHPQPDRRRLPAACRSRLARAAVGLSRPAPDGTGRLVSACRSLGRSPTPPCLRRTTCRR